MKKIINSIKLDKIKHSNLGIKILIGDRLRYENVIRNYCAIKILEKKVKVNPIILSQTNIKNNINYFYKKLGFKKIIKTSIDLNVFIFLKFFTMSLYYIKKFLKFAISNNFDGFINNFQVEGIKIGDIIYDRYIRDGHKYLKPNFFDYSFIKYLLITTYKTIFLKNYIVKEKIKLIIINSHSYANNYSILFKLAKHLKINLLYLKDFQINYFKNGFFSKKNDLRILTKEKFTSIKLSKKDKVLFDSYLKKKIKGKLDHFDNKNAYLNRKKTITNLLKRNKILSKNYKKKILIASHSLSDANHFYFEFGVRSFFYDYHSALIDILKFANKNQDILFLLRPHPSSKFWRELGIVKEIYKKYKSKNIIYVDNEFNTHDLLSNVDTVVTVNGSIAYEASGIYKMKPIVATKGFFPNLGFIHISKSKKDFFNKILLNKSNHELNSRAFIDAKKALFYYEIIVKNEYNSIIAKRKTLIKDKNYMKEISSYLKINKNFNKDKYYINLKNTCNNVVSDLKNHL